MSDSEQVHSKIGQENFNLLSDEMDKLTRTFRPETLSF